MDNNNTSDNPLLTSIQIPGETFRLPSHGLFYTNNELDESVVNGEVEVFPMTAYDEILMSTPDKLLSGKAVVEVFSRCIPQINNAFNILAKDVDFLLACLRMVSFGNQMEVAYTHDCDNAKEHTYVINLQQVINSSKSIDPTTLNEEYKKTLSNGQTISFKPVTYGEMIKIYDMTILNKSKITGNETPDELDIKRTDEAHEAENIFVETTVIVIKDVDGISDRGHIKEWLRGLKLGWKRDITKAVQQVSDWGIDLKSPQICPDCKSAVNLKISANPVNFFI